MRRTLYARGLLRTKKLPAPVVSVGNLTVGGTGKTPVVACLARLWQDRGRRVAILSRGYGGQSRGVTCISDGQNTYKKPPEVGEEPYWLARTLPGVAVYTGACRYAAGLAAWEEFQPDLFLLDDGFQHFQLHRDLDLVLLDAASPFGNGYLLPRGPLREPLAALAAAQSLILTRFDPERHQAQLAAIRRAFPDKTVLTATIAPVRVTAYPGGEAEAPAALRHRALVAFAGLARPEVFAATLAGAGGGPERLPNLSRPSCLQPGGIGPPDGGGPGPGGRGPDHHRQGLGQPGRALGWGSPPVGPGSGGPAGGTRAGPGPPGPEWPDLRQRRRQSLAPAFEAPSPFRQKAYNASAG